MRYPCTGSEVPRPTLTLFMYQDLRCLSPLGMSLTTLVCASSVWVCGQKNPVKFPNCR